MSRRKLSKGEVDHLLGQTMADDLPPEAERLLQRDVHEWWRAAVVKSEADRGASRRPGTSGRGGAFASLWAGWFGRVQMAAASLVLIFLGVSLEWTRAPGLLAKSLTLQQHSVQVLRQVRRAEAMRCTLRILPAQGPVLDYQIEWTDSGGTRVRTEYFGRPRVRDFRFATERVRVAQAREAPTKTLPGGEVPLDSSLRPIEDFITPESLARFLAGRWQPEPLPPGANPGGSAYAVSLPARSLEIHIVVDPRNHLPVSLEAQPLAGAGQGSTTIKGLFAWRLAEGGQAIIQVLGEKRHN